MWAALFIVTCLVLLSILFSLYLFYVMINDIVKKVDEIYRNKGK